MMKAPLRPGTRPVGAAQLLTYLLTPRCYFTYLLTPLIIFDEEGRLQYRFESLAGSLQGFGHLRCPPDGSASTHDAHPLRLSSCGPSRLDGGGV